METKVELINILEGEKIYGIRSKCVKVLKPEQTDFVTYIDMDKPAYIFQGNYGPSARLYLKGGDEFTFMIKSLDKESTLTVGQFFDVKKCLITGWQKPGSNEIKYRILVCDDALVTK